MMTIIFGPNGYGKSSLMTYFLNESAFDHERIRKGQEEILKLNEEYGIRMPLPKHFTYLNGTANFAKEYYSKRRNLDLDPARLGIQSEAPEGKKCQFILPYATLGVDEAQTWFSSRDGDVENYQFSFFEKHRHNNLNIFFSTTRAKLIDVRIRALSQGLYIKNREVKKMKYDGMKITWTVDRIDVGNIDGYLDCNPQDKKYYSKEEKITCNYNVFDIYDPESCKKLFYDGFTEQDFRLNYGV